MLSPYLPVVSYVVAEGNVEESIFAICCHSRGMPLKAHLNMRMAGPDMACPCHSRLTSQVPMQDFPDLGLFVTHSRC